MTLKLGVPSKGRLMEKTFDWFAGHGISMARSGAEREYSGTVEGIADVELVLMAAGEVPRELAAGRIHMGVTGSDLVRETLPLWQRQVSEMCGMGFGHADLVIAVPDCWVDVETLDDLDAAAAAFRIRHGFRLRIATKYHRLIRTYLRAHEIADYQLVDSQGATEGTVRNETAEAVADITSTGETLRANHLRMLSDGPVHRSQATLFHALAAPWDAPATAAAERIRERLGLAG